MKKNDEQDDILDLAERTKLELIDALSAISNNVGCELLVRRAFPHSKSDWAKMPLKAPFASAYRAFVQEGFEEQLGAELALLKYDAVIEGELVGVAYAEEIEGFLNELPKKGSAQKFAGTKRDASSQNERCVRIKVPGVDPILAFGAAGMSMIGDFRKSIVKVPIVYDKEQGMQSAPEGLLNLNTQSSFVVFKGCVFVFKNGNFAKMTGYREVIQERAKAAAKELVGLKFLKLKNPKALNEIIAKSPDFGRRLSASAARGYIKNLTKDGLKNVLDEFGAEFYTEDAKGNIILEPDLSDAGEKRKFLKVLTQVFVICAATGEKLEAPRAVPFKA